MSEYSRIVSPHKYQERILAFGGGGVGKSSALLNIARYSPDAMFWVLDNDTSFAYTRLIYTEYPEILEYGDQTTEYVDTPSGVTLPVQQLGNVKVVELGPTWEEWSAGIQYLIGTVEIVQGKGTVFTPGIADPSNDWIALDSVTHPWQYVQAWYSQQVHGTNLADQMVKLRSQSSSLEDYNKALAGDMTWPIINREYTDHFIRLVHRWRGHLYMTSEADPLGKREDEQDKDLFGTIGFKPKGQKSLHHQMSTNLFFYRGDKPNEWKITTAKDRGRRILWRESLNEFAMDYLVEVAGWKVLPPKRV
jgi:hypothetical protein